MTQNLRDPCPLDFFHKPKYPPLKHYTQIIKDYNTYLNFQQLWIYELCFLY